MTLAQVEQARRRAESLTARQREVMVLLSRGMSSAEIGAALHRSRDTVENHIAAISRVLGVRGRTRIAVLGVRLGMV